MATQRREFSPALLAAQRRLKLLQERSRQERAACGQSLSAQDCGRSLQPAVPDSHPDHFPRHVAGIIPDHLGWESAPLTAALRAAYWRDEKARVTTGDQRKATSDQELATSNRRPVAGFVAGVGQQTPGNETSSNLSVKLYPDIALGMLRQEQATTGRIWLLLRHLDENGCGWVSAHEARQCLTHKKSTLRVCSWRQLRNLLAQGENIFWQRQNERIWLRSTAKVAAALGVWRLQHRPVALPLSVLKQRIGTVRAHFYASFHSGRVKETRAGTEQPQPIGRNTIAEITEISPRTQRIYEKKANVQKQHNYALGEKVSADQEQERAWRHGHALFRLTDYTGKQGKPGTTYLAWQLPNNYAGPHRQQSKGQQKRINRKLTDLFMQGITGNEQKKVNRSGARRCRRFYGNGRLAAKAYSSGSRDIYWRSCHRTGGHGRYQLWYFLPDKD